MLDTYEALFKLCSESILKLHAANFHLYKTTVRWCGRLINQKGVSMDPSNMQALLDMAPPTTADQLQQCVCRKLDAFDYSRVEHFNGATVYSIRVHLQ